MNIRNTNNINILNQKPINKQYEYIYMDKIYLSYNRIYIYIYIYEQTLT